MNKKISKIEKINILNEAYKYDLQYEIFHSAFKHKEQFPHSSLLECLQVGADEWDIK